ncbi:hypothetical protein KY290_021655 [Solanum tuberosum]|uniref:Ubiquitin-like protease family profile domain-containing protein n=1 Tax=Solanum tuberosum TaxID=4113 RepID=A0ABQ7V274_SOLTU|nr:hypothetical protein KY290_021655 [Solanum tuberosum]
MDKTLRKSPRLNKQVMGVDSPPISTDVHYSERHVGDPLVYGKRDNIPQQDDTSTDCGLYICSFAKFVCRGGMDISMSIFDSESLRLRYRALLWEYEKRKIETDTVSENEAFVQGGQLIRRVKD